ncbi:hypothetical protein SEVIR_5G425750v4 [Setaria viridis]
MRSYVQHRHVRVLSTRGDRSRQLVSTAPWPQKKLCVFQASSRNEMHLASKPRIIRRRLDTIRIRAPRQREKRENNRGSRRHLPPPARRPPAATMIAASDSTWRRASRRRILSLSLGAPGTGEQ